MFGFQSGKHVPELAEEVVQRLVEGLVALW